MTTLKALERPVYTETRWIYSVGYANTSNPTLALNATEISAKGNMNIE